MYVCIMKVNIYMCMYICKYTYECVCVCLCVCVWKFAS